jgi:hypothetical protein
MFYDRELIANANGAQHWNALWAGRNYVGALEDEVYARARSHNMQVNANILTRDFWQATDNTILELRDQEDGMEIVNDLLKVQTILPIGKTVKMYNVVGAIADDVQVTMDGQAPYSFDHTEYASDGDPIPIITAGYGVNWRHQQGLQTVGIDLTRDSQTAKLREYNKKIVSHVLDGNTKIVVNGKASQGLRTHRNTKKINLGAAGANIDLTTATSDAMLSFFQGQYFSGIMTTNRVTALDVLWVSYQIYENMSKSVIQNGVNIGPAYTYIRANQSRIRDIRPTFALTGNEMIGYIRRRDYVSPLVGMPTSIMALPRPMPQSNYNFQIMSAMGLQITADSAGLSGVFYWAVLA